MEEDIIIIETSIRYYSDNEKYHLFIHNPKQNQEVLNIINQ